MRKLYHHSKLIQRPLPQFFSLILVLIMLMPHLYMYEYTKILLSFFNSHNVLPESIVFFVTYICFKMSFNEVKFPYWIRSLINMKQRFLNIHLDLSPPVSEEVPQGTVLEKHNPDAICSEN